MEEGLLGFGYGGVRYDVLLGCGVFEVWWWCWFVWWVLCGYGVVG